MLTDQEAERIVGATLVSADGEELGSVETVLTHAADNRAAWAAAKVGDRRVIVPLDEASTEADRLLVRYDAGQIKGSPDHDGETLDADSVQPLYEHYGIDDSTMRDDSGFVTDVEARTQDTSRDPAGGGGADDASQGHP